MKVVDFYTWLLLFDTIAEEADTTAAHVFRNQLQQPTANVSPGALRQIHPSTVKVLATEPKVSEAFSLLVKTVECKRSEWCHCQMEYKVFVIVKSLKWVLLFL